MLGNNMFAYCGNNPENTSDFTGDIPKELDYRASSMYGGGTSGPIIPIRVPYDEIPYDEKTMEKWIAKHGYENEAYVFRAIKDVSDGVQSIRGGFTLLMLPEPTLILDLTGITKITNGVLQSVVGITKLLIWLCGQENN